MLLEIKVCQRDCDPEVENHCTGDGSVSKKYLLHKHEVLNSDLSICVKGWVWLHTQRHEDLWGSLATRQAQEETLSQNIKDKSVK